MIIEASTRNVCQAESLSFAICFFDILQAYSSLSKRSRGALAALQPAILIEGHLVPTQDGWKSASCTQSFLVSSGCLRRIGAMVLRKEKTVAP